MGMNLEEVSKMYAITDEELRERQNNIIKIMLHGKIPSNKPKAIFDIGPSGSGKTGLNGYAIGQFPNNNLVVVNNDELKPFYPRASEISKLYPEYYIKVTNEASKVWTDMLMATAINGQYNVLYEGTGRKIAIFQRMIEKMKEYGYQIIVRAMAVNELNCLMSIIERYEYQVKQKGWGRLVSLPTFYKAYDNEMLDTIDAFEESADISLVEVYTRGTKPSQPTKIYSSDNREGGSARKAVIAGRERDKKVACQYYETCFRPNIIKGKKTPEEEGILEHIDSLYRSFNDIER